MAKTKWHSTNFRGVRYREHKSRKHNNQKDRYYAIRYQKGNDSGGHPIRKEEGLGWASEGWTSEKAAIELGKNREAATKGEGPRSLKEKRIIAQEKREAEERESILLNDFYNNVYTLYAKRTKKKDTWDREQDLYKRWIEPTLGNLPMKKISETHLFKIKKCMEEAGRAPRTIQYVFAVIRLIYNVARKKHAYARESPTSQINMPKIDNGRLRFLTVDEAKKLLECLRKRDHQAYEMALLALLSGMRFGEIALLCFQDIDIASRIITVRDPKNKSTRVVYMCDQLLEVFKSNLLQGEHEPGHLIFPHPKGGRHKKQPWAFRMAVKDSGLNKGITDNRLKFTFHGLRHTHGSWAAQQGVDILTIKEMLGHKTLVMAMRYSHLSAQAVRSGVNKVAGAFGTMTEDREENLEQVNIS